MIEAQQTDAQFDGTQLSRKKHRAKVEKVTVTLAVDRVITVTGFEATVDGLIELLEEALSKARKARQMKFGLKTFVSMLKDQMEN